MTYSALQENFLLGMAVNQKQSTLGGGLSLKMAPCINQVLSVLDLSEWEVIWGPAIYQTVPDGVFDNAAFVAFNAARSAYFVSVAGTDPASVYDWWEDLDVGHTKPWPLNPDGGQVANGDFTALMRTLKMRPVDSLPGAGLTLQGFLHADLAKRTGPCTVITGGHSLGGALAPLMALWLTDSQAQWDPDGKVTGFSCWASAGPTPGLADFAAYYNARVPETHRIHNSLDVVPHAFDADDLAQVPGLYHPPQHQSILVRIASDMQLHKVKGLDYTQQGLNDVALTGVYKPMPGDTGHEAFEAFAKELVYQHSEAYFHLLDLSAQYTAYTGVCPRD